MISRTGRGSDAEGHRTRQPARTSCRRSFLQAAAFGSLALRAPPGVARPASDPLPSWRDGGAKRTILDFVAGALHTGGPRFIPRRERIAVFDNDGTLWCERPSVEALYVVAKARELARRRPELEAREPYASLLARGADALDALPPAARLQLLADTHTGMTDEEFVADVQHFLTTAKHPTFGVSFLELTYLPQLELLAHLRQSEFDVWLCSGGEISFARVVAEKAYGIPPDKVIGTCFKTVPEQHHGRSSLRRTSEVVALNEKDDKPGNILRHAGRRPVLAAGNEGDGEDTAMLRYVHGNALPSLSLLVNHDDERREYAYAEKDGASLEAARRHGFTVVSAKHDWRRIFSFQD